MKLAGTGLIILLLSLFVPSVQSAEFGGTVRADICTECGQVLVGAAHIEPDAIQWIGSSSPTVFFASSQLSIFGFTGESRYRGESKQGEWSIESSSVYTIGSPAPNRKAPSLGFFFAPQTAGTASSTLSFQWTPNTQTLQVQGTGIADSVATPNLTLGVSPSGHSTSTPCADRNDGHCEELSVSNRGTVSFAVTPHVNSASLPSGAQAEHLVVYLDVNEKNTHCSTNSTSFQETGSVNNFSIDQYYHYLSPIKPEKASNSCRRTHPALVSKERTFTMTAKNLKTTDKGYVEYTFYIFGHYDSRNPANWPGSHYTYRLKTASGSVVTQPTPTTASLTVQVKGNGSVNSSPTGIQTCTSGGGSNCSASFTINTPVTLMAVMTSDETVTWSGNCSGNGQNTSVIMSNSSVNCTATFTSIQPDIIIKPVAHFTATPTQGPAPLNVSLDANNSTGNIKQYVWQIDPPLSNTPVVGATPSVKFPTAGTYTVSLTVIDDSGNSNTSPEQQIVVEFPPINVNAALTADFTIETPTIEEVLEAAAEDKKQLSMTLKASYPNADSYKWFVLQKTDANTLDIRVNPEKSGNSTLPVDLLESGNYLVILEVTQGEQTAVTSQMVTLPHLLAEFTATPTAGNSPLTVELNAFKTQAYFEKIGIKATDWQWWRSDLVEVKDKSPNTTTTFSAEGDYIITLLVTTNEGHSVSASQIIYVGDYQPPVAVLEIPTLSTDVLGVQMSAGNSTATSSVDNLSPRLTDYQWSIKDFFSGEETFIKDQRGAEANIPLSEGKTSQILLRVTDNVGLTGLSATGFMQVSRGTSADKSGTLSGSDATFLGLVGQYRYPTRPQADGNWNSDPIDMNAVINWNSDPIDMNAVINVDPKDVGKTAELLAVILPPDNQFRMKVNKGNPLFQIWPGAYQAVANLEAATEFESLESQLKVPVLNGTLANNDLSAAAGTYSVWVGYRLEDGTIVFNQSPFIFEVVAEVATASQ